MFAISFVFAVNPFAVVILTILSLQVSSSMAHDTLGAAIA